MCMDHAYAKDLRSFRTILDRLLASDQSFTVPADLTAWYWAKMECNPLPPQTIAPGVSQAHGNPIHAFTIAPTATTFICLLLRPAYSTYTKAVEQPVRVPRT